MASPQHPDTLPNALSWADQAACRGYDLDAFFTDSKYGVESAKRICAGCPVRDLCLDEVLDAETDSRYGIYGGLTPDERSELVTGVPRGQRGKNGGGGKPPAPCGTRGAYERHQRNGEPIDQACQEAYDAHLAEQRARQAERRATRRTAVP